MNHWIWIIGIFYISLLVLVSYRAWRGNKDTKDYLMAGSGIGSFLGLFTFAATLFSTFTLMGMPDFFRSNGVGSWIFLAVSDAAMVFFIVGFGYYLRKRVSAKGFQGVAGLMHDCYQNKWAGYLFFLGAFLFLVPYVAIQIRGIAIFLHAAFPEALPAWGWSMAIVVVMLLYSEVGGLKAIIYSDVIQGILLLSITWIIALGCLEYFGGLEAMFRTVGETKVELLSVPGPNGLFTAQFLIASFFAILMIPVTQPQLTTRLVIMKSEKSLHRMAVSVGFFAMIIIFPTGLIGMYGAVKYPDASTADFLVNVLLLEQPGIIAAIAILGLIAAAISTTDSQIFALGTEMHFLTGGEDGKGKLVKTKLGILFFAVAALIFSILSSDELVLLARVSFAGTSLMAPMILTGIFYRGKPGMEIPAATFLGMGVFILSLLGVLPDKFFGIRLDLGILMLLTVVALVSMVVRKGKATAIESQEFEGKKAFVKDL